MVEIEGFWNVGLHAELFVLEADDARSEKDNGTCAMEQFPVVIHNAT